MKFITALFMICVLSSCSLAEGGHVTSPPPASNSGTVGPPTQTQNELFLTAVFYSFDQSGSKNLHRLTLGNDSESLIILGSDVCDFLDSGNSIEESFFMVSNKVEESLGEDAGFFAGTIVAASIGVFCQQHESTLKSWINAHDNSSNAANIA
jgi:hypothetical protein